MLDDDEDDEMLPKRKFCRFVVNKKNSGGDGWVMRKFT